MPLPIGNTSVQGPQEDLRYVDMGFSMANDHLPAHGHHDSAINNYAGVGLDVPAQAQAAPLDPVCTNLNFPHTHI